LQELARRRHRQRLRVVAADAGADLLQRRGASVAASAMALEMLQLVGWYSRWRRRRRSRTPTSRGGMQRGPAVDLALAVGE
jgi:hypothetical protein